jgi:molybdate transport system ATP-binding protein
VLAADFEVSRRDFPVAASLQLGPGERLALLGASGAGKTTILEALAGFLPLSAGEIWMDGRLLSRAGSRPVLPRARGVALVGGSAALFPHLTVIQNICYSPQASAALGRRHAVNLGLGRLLASRPASLSEGERRRVALARALAAGCQTLCLDEPFAALDRPLAEELLALVRELTESLPAGAILVTHRLEEAQAFADRIAVLDRGRVAQVGSARELLRRPKTPEVARMMGYRGWLRSVDTTLAVHPELSRIDGPGELRISCRVLSCRPFGGRFDLELVAQDGWAGRLHLHHDSPVEVGTEVVLVTLEPVTMPRSAGSDAGL